MRIVSISRYLPYPGIDHAGGEYYRRHLELLASRHDVVVAVPASPANEVAADQQPVVAHRWLVVGSGRRDGRWSPATLVGRVLPFLAVRTRSRALLRDPRLVEALRDADRIELQWFSSVLLAPLLRRAFTATPLVGVFHDVVSQEQRRRLLAAGGSLRSRSAALARLAVALPLERRALRALDTAVVLSEKDGALLAGRGGRARVVVVAPPLDEEGMPARPEPRPPRHEVLFVGALGRAPNQDAVRWLVADIWPRVRSAVPDARLTIAGGGASPDLVSSAAGRPGVELTGHVPDLSPYYRRATVLVAPLRLGAGVKLKCVTAMLWGLPVVSTSVGAEGIGGPELFSAVEDDAGRLAAAVVTVLRDPQAAGVPAARALAWARDTYSTDAYLRSLVAIYG